YNFAGTNQTDVWLMLGDNAYNSGLDSEYQTGVFDVYPQLFRHAVVWPALGNHDTAQSHVSNDTYAYFDIFTLPKSGEAGGEASGSEHFYSFDYGNIHFVCLDSMTDLLRATNSAMANWLRGDLANNTNTWLIAYFHHPPYTKGSHDSDDVTNDYELVEMRENFLPILESYGVDLVLSGHSHVYERSYFIDRHYGYSDSFDTSTNIVQPGSGRVGGTGAYTKATGLPVHKGAVYVVCGSSGATGGGTLDHPAMYVSLNNLGSMVIDVSSNRLDATFLRESGIVPATNDWFTIIKQPPAPPVASNLTFNLPADSATNLFLVGSDPGGRPLTFATNSVATRGLVTGFTASNGAFTYTPAHGFVGGDGFTFLVNNGITNSPTATVTLNVLALAEANSNGIPDVWESLYGVTNASADPDGDGLSNLQEYLANTNPTNAASALLAPTVTRTTNGFAVLTWPSIGGCRYRVKFSNGDATGNYNGAFTDVARPIDKEMDPAPIGTPTTQSWTDNFTFTGGAPATGRRYYRIEVVR
ncbi:MAG TPA: metallophosphoesterase, partial [Verrucomicrobiae bacterium]